MLDAAYFNTDMLARCAHRRNSGMVVIGASSHLVTGYEAGTEKPLTGEIPDPLVESAVVLLNACAARKFPKHFCLYAQICAALHSGQRSFFLCGNG